MSLEGVLTGGALGLVFLYLFQEAAQAAGERLPRGPVFLKGPVEFGPFSGGGGRINIRPLEQGEPDLPSRRIDGSIGQGSQKQGAGVGGQGGFLSGSRRDEQDSDTRVPRSQVSQPTSPSPSPSPSPSRAATLLP